MRKILLLGGLASLPCDTMAGSRSRRAVARLKWPSTHSRSGANISTATELQDTGGVVIYLGTKWLGGEGDLRLH